VSISGYPDKIKGRKKAGNSDYPWFQASANLIAQNSKTGTYSFTDRWLSQHALHVFVVLSNSVTMLDGRHRYVTAVEKIR
jgi:hypothetical protein